MGDDRDGPTESFEPVEITLGALRDRIRPLIVWSLFWGPRSFSELTDAIPGQSASTLRRVLGEMEGSGLVGIEAQEGPRRQFRFVLTPYGETLKPVVAVMYEWGLRFLSASSSTTRPRRAAPSGALGTPPARAGDAARKGPCR